MCASQPDFSEPNEPSIRAKETLDEHQEVTPAEKMAVFAFTFAAWSIEDCLDEAKEAMINMRSRNKRSESEDKRRPSLNKSISENEPLISQKGKSEVEELDTLTTSTEYWGAINPPLMVHLSMSEETKAEWKKAYQDDPMFSEMLVIVRTMQHLGTILCGQRWHDILQ